MQEWNEMMKDVDIIETEEKEDEEQEEFEIVESKWTKGQKTKLRQNITRAFKEQKEKPRELKTLSIIEPAASSSTLTSCGAEAD